MRERPPIAILCGFHYPVNDTIPGILVDLYRVARYCTIINMDYYVFTDYISNPKIDELLPSMIKGHVDSGVDQWLDQIKKSNKYFFVDNESSFIPTILSKIDKNNNIFFYFSGHGHQGSIVLPSNEFVSIHWLSYKITQKLDPTQELFILLDCCEAFQLSHWRYSFSTLTKNLSSNTVNTIFNPNKIYCLCSTQETPVTSANGSKFSRDIIDLLTSKKREWMTYPSSYILSTHLPPRLIPSWVLGEELITICPYWIKIII